MNNLFVALLHAVPLAIIVCTHCTIDSIKTVRIIIIPHVGQV